MRHGPASRASDVAADVGDGRDPLGLYVHVPFCAHKCFYCDFVAYIYNPRRAGAYLEALAREAALLAGLPGVAGRRAASLFLGGGTPSALSVAEIGELVASVTAGLLLDEAAEVTLEANPETLDADKLTRCRALGVNRLSLGLQAWDDGLLRRLGRAHTVGDFLEAFRRARAAGFDNLGVDLIFGLPGQTLAGWRETLERVAALGPEHVSAYSLQVEEGTAFRRWVREDRFEKSGTPLPDDDAQAEMYSLAREALAAAGYEHYEISNFARPGYRSHHNQIYWRNGEYLGLGPGAHSRLGRRRWANTRRLDDYRERLAAGRLPVEEEETLSEAREMSDTVILGLRLLEGVDLGAFARRFGRPLLDVYGPQVDGLRAGGWLEVAGGRLRLTERALPVANEVFARFV